MSNPTGESLLQGSAIGAAAAEPSSREAHQSHGAVFPVSPVPFPSACASTTIGLPTHLTRSTIGTEVSPLSSVGRFSTKVPASSTGSM